MDLWNQIFKPFTSKKAIDRPLSPQQKEAACLVFGESSLECQKLTGRQKQQFVDLAYKEIRPGLETLAANLETLAGQLENIGGRLSVVETWAAERKHLTPRMSATLFDNGPDWMNELHAVGKKDQPAAPDDWVAATGRLTKKHGRAPGWLKFYD